MKKNLIVWQVAGLTFTAVFGTILHFLYQWTGVSFFAPISAVNESTWEHMKLVFVPSLIFAFVQSFFVKDDYDCYFLVKLIGITIGTMLIPILFYTLSGAFGKLSAIINISIFFFAIIVQYFVEIFMLENIICRHNLKLVYITILICILLLFFVFTFYPPKIPLFLDPVTNGYGIIF